MDIVIIIKERCPYCKQMLERFHKLLSTGKYNGINIRYIQDESEASKQYDYFYVPAVFLGEKRMIHGASTKEDVAKILRLAKTVE